jgi:hypothetical protein
VGPRPFAPRRLLFSAIVVLVCVSFASLSRARAAAPRQTGFESGTTTCAGMEKFLKTAKIGRQRGIAVGVTGPTRATLSDGSVQHDASIQTTDVSRARFETSRRTELNFRDSWKFNVAGYELAKLLSLNMVPPYVERSVSGQPASVSWWVDDAMMERERYERKIQPPDLDSWAGEMYAVRVFHQLVYDTDPNLTNLLITKDWRIWMIDFTRAFRLMTTLPSAKDLVKCDRRLLASLRSLNFETLQHALGSWLTKPEIEGVLARRDLIVRFFDGEVARKGEAAVLYDLPRSGESCGTGLR